MFRIKDGREHFYQWDLNRQIIIDDPGIEEVHFCNRTENCALICKTYTENGATVADVPNVLLQSDWRIRVYGWDGNATRYDKYFDVKPRSKPADYYYTETDIYTVEKAVDTALTEAKESGLFDGYSPVRGVDYWTELDKTAIRAENKAYIDETIGGALDSIISLQESYMGGVNN